MGQNNLTGALVLACRVEVNTFIYQMEIFGYLIKSWSTDFETQRELVKTDENNFAITITKIIQG